MALPPETETQILRYHHAERWPIGTIASQLNLHRDSVARVLTQAGLPTLGLIRRPSAIDPYLPFILETLAQFPPLRASRLSQMVKDRGYPGKPDHFRHLIARHRPRPKHEAYLRLRTLPGEQCQIDWGHFGHLDIGQAHQREAGQPVGQVYFHRNGGRVQAQQGAALHQSKTHRNGSPQACACNHGDGMRQGATLHNAGAQFAGLQPL